MIGLTTLPCFGAGKVSSDSFSQGFKGLCPIRYFVARRMERFTGISRGQWSSSQIFLVQSRVYAINLLFATVVLEASEKCRSEAGEDIPTHAAPSPAVHVTFRSRGTNPPS